MEDKTIYHIHHIVPRHMGGTDDASNLIKLTVEEHAEAHRALWEKHGSEYDRIAWQGLTGNITKEECRILAVKEALIGRKQTPEHIAKRSASLKEHIKKHGAMTLGKKLGPASDERKRKISEANAGKPSPFKGQERHSINTKERMAAAAKTRALHMCPKCGAEMQKANLSRYHGLDGSKCASRL